MTSPNFTRACCGTRTVLARYPSRPGLLDVAGTLLETVAPWEIRGIRPSSERRPDKTHAAACLLCLRNASRSLLIWSALVVGIPCGKPGYTFSVAFFTIFEDIRAAAAMGTI